MRGRLLVALLLVPLLAGGCVTRSLWSGWQPDPTPLPVSVEGGVRAGDGAFHVLARCEDDRVRRVVVRPFEAASPDWPDANRCGDDLVTVTDDVDLPRGFPLRTTVDPAEAAGEVVDDQPLVVLEGRALRVQDRGGPWTLATFAPPGPPQPTSERLVIVALTPLALLADIASLPLVLVGVRLVDDDAP